MEEKAVKGVKKQRKVLKKIPSRIIRDAKGLAIFTSMRTGASLIRISGGGKSLIGFYQGSRRWEERVEQVWSLLAWRMVLGPHQHRSLP